MQLIEIKPDRAAKKLYESLVGIDAQKETLLNSLMLILDKDRVQKWKNKHHKKGMPFLDYCNDTMPLVVLEGEVGCGKSALARAIGFPLKEALKKNVITLETPSDIRGSGMVGEISNRITAAFKAVKAKLKNGEVGILIIDEADDLATSRTQNQAHHEDRAGLNVLIKQLDLLSRENVDLAVIMITNRLAVIDPAVHRRASAIIKFERPKKEQLKAVFQFIFGGMDYSAKELAPLISYCSDAEIPFSYSDLIQRVGKQTLRQCIPENKPFSIDRYLAMLKTTAPSPLIQAAKL